MSKPKKLVINLLKINKRKQRPLNKAEHFRYRYEAALKSLDAPILKKKRMATGLLKGLKQAAKMKNITTEEQLAKFFQRGVTRLLKTLVKKYPNPSDHHLIRSSIEAYMNAHNSHIPATHYVDLTCDLENKTVQVTVGIEGQS